MSVDASDTNPAARPGRFPALKQRWSTRAGARRLVVLTATVPTSVMAMLLSNKGTWKGRGKCPSPARSPFLSVEAWLLEAEAAGSTIRTNSGGGPPQWRAADLS